MNMGTGYYWCDHCDDSTNGADCPTCRQPCRFVPTKLSKSVKPPKKAPVVITPELPPKPPVPTGVAKHSKVYTAEERLAAGRKLFAKMREAVTGTLL